jgi:hypothetical protein
VLFSYGYIVFLLDLGVKMIAPNAQADGPSVQTANAIFTPATDGERNEVRSQLERILASPAFQNSKRYAAVLKYVVDQTLLGAGERLKERTIGIEVFHRAPDYDTAADHAVRSAVAEIRKRLAQYYQGDARGELKIEVLPGSYMPQFRRAGEIPSALPGILPADPEPAGQSAVSSPMQIPHRRVNLRPAWWIASGAVVLASVVLVIATDRSPDTFDSFWKPILSSRAPVLLCIGNVEGGRGQPGEGPSQTPPLSLRDFHNSASETVNVYDAFTLAKFAGLLEAKGRRFQFASQSDATFTDLQNGPTILVGLLNNNWTERLVPNLRFTAEWQDANKVVIRDHNDPKSQGWSVDYSAPYLDMTRDYALVLRMLDPKTEQMVVVAAGITVFGTSAAGDFLTSHEEMKKLAAIAPPGWEKKNMEIVLSTDVIRGRSGPATVVAAQFW